MIERRGAASTGRPEDRRCDALLASLLTVLTSILYNLDERYSFSYYYEDALTDTRERGRSAATTAPAKDSPLTYTVQHLPTVRI